MLDAAREAAEIAKGHSARDLSGDRLRSLALVKCIEIIGEAASRVSPDARAARPEIPWTDIIGMRNRLIHAYFEIDFDRVSDTVSTDLPPLIFALESILGSSSADS
jgi:uncharacterized protein with HEPN domain